MIMSTGVQHVILLFNCYAVLLLV